MLLLGLLLKRNATLPNVLAKPISKRSVHTIAIFSAESVRPLKAMGGNVRVQQGIQYRAPSLGDTQECL